MALQIMYPANESLATQLTVDISASAQMIKVADISVFPPAPNFATIGTENDAEVILYNAVDQAAGQLAGVLRGQSGTISRSWLIGADIYHSWTAANANAIMQNVTQLSTQKADRTVEQIANRIYPGADLTTAFSEEIATRGDVWAWIQARIRAANFTGINIGDYIPFTVGSYTIKAEVAGIDTYYNYGDAVVKHHIDFISRDCWPDLHVFNKVIYNNGTSVSPSPWLASDLYAYLNSVAMSVPNAAAANPALIAVDYSVTGVYDKLPAALKAVIVGKRMLLPSRYTAGFLLTNDNSWAWQDAGKLWIPSEVEVYGTEHFGSKNGFSGGGFQQYPIFATNMKRIKGAGDGGGRSIWWLLSALGGSSTNFALVGNGGDAGSGSASHAGIRVPVCFRIA